MSKRIRQDFAGAVHHVYSRGNNKRDIFLDEEDKSFFMGRLRRLKEEGRGRLYAYCLMTNHFHLLFETGTVPLASMMSRLLTSYAMRFHRRYGTTGHVFGDKYGAKLCARDSYFIRVIRYIHRNPVKAGLVGDPAHWNWSGHGELASATSRYCDIDTPLAYFADEPSAAAQAYAEFSTQRRDDADFEPLDEPALRPGLPAEHLALARQVAESYALPWEELLSGSRKRHLTEAKAVLAKLGRANGLNCEALARLLACTPQSVLNLLSRPQTTE